MVEGGCNQPMTNSSATTAQTPTLPQLNSPFVDEGGIIQQVWYRFLVSLANKTGLGVATNLIAYVEYNATTGILTAYSASTNQPIGEINLNDNPGLAPVVETPTISPFVFTAKSSGTLFSSGGTIQISRNNGMLLPANTPNAGGATPLRTGDSVSISWSGGAPEVTWFAD